MNIRTVSKIVQSHKTLEGAGFVVHRAFPIHGLNAPDPFLLLDEMGPEDLKPGEAKGAPDHPHRGFETVTYMLEGRMNHKDSNGNKGSIGPGDVQWMTAGSGVIHSEMPSPEIIQKGGRMHGFQLWVNLPKRDKMIKPYYQEMLSEKIPMVQKDGVKVKVIAGASLGKSAVIATKTPIVYLHVMLEPRAPFDQIIPENYNVVAYVISGTILIGSDKTAKQHQSVLFNNEGSRISISASADTSADFLLIGGVPLNEPIARYGPFVMNTETEIQQAIDDYNQGRLGSIDF